MKYDDIRIIAARWVAVLTSTGRGSHYDLETLFFVIDISIQGKMAIASTEKVGVDLNPIDG